MNSLAHLVLLGWIPACLVLCAVLGARVGVAAALVGGPMFLPVLNLDLPGPLDLGKAEATSLALLFAVLVFDPPRLSAYRFRPIDLLFLGWVVSGSTASLANDLGVYDAFATALNRLVRWGIPYWIGTVYFGSREGLRLALWALFLGALAYMPLVLFEVRMSPQLHYLVYGASQHSFEQTIRGGGYRPMVFMAHGLELSLWMCAGVVAGFVLWRSHRGRAPLGLPVGAALLALAVTAVLCKSTGAILLGLIGVVASLPLFRSFACHALMGFVPVFMLVRLFGSGALERTLVELSESISDDRAGSLRYRFENEQLLLERLWRNPWFGAGGWDFGSMVDPETGEVSLITTDSYWIIMAATTGLFGLIATIGMLWLPVVRGLRRLTAADWERLAACLVLGMLILDSLVNAFVPPYYIALAGALGHVPLWESDQQAAVPTAAAAAPDAARVANAVGAPAPAVAALDPLRQPLRPGSRRDVAWLQPRSARSS